MTGSRLSAIALGRISEMQPITHAAVSWIGSTVLRIIATSVPIRVAAGGSSFSRLGPSRIDPGRVGGV